MVLFGTLRPLLAPPHFEDDEQNRIAGVLHISIGAILIGLCVILVHRFLKLDFDLVPSIASLSLVLAVSFVMIRRGHLKWARGLSLWSLLLFLVYQCYKDDGVHDVALFAFPGVLVMAALVLDRAYFWVFTGCAVLSVGFLGYLETVGAIHTLYSSGTDTVRIFDLLAIFTVTAVPIRLLADSFKKNLTHVRQNEEEIRKHADRLRESEKRYRTLFDGANDAIFIMTGDRFAECNVMTLTMFGCDERSDIVGHHPWEFSPPLQPDGMNSKEKAMGVIQAAIQGTPQRFYWKHRRKEGTLFDAEVSLSRLEFGNEILVQALVRDITERMLADKALKESEERFRTLFESQGEGAGVVDENERFVLCNPAGESILGVPPGGLVGRSLREFVSPEQWRLIQSQTKMRREGKKSTYEMEVLRPDGETRLVIVTATPRYQDGQFIGAFGVFRDITEHQRLQQQLIQSQKIQSLGTLAGGVAHDFNNILSIILGYASELEKAKSDPARFADALRTINSAVGRGAALVQQILTFARRTEFMFEPVIVPELVRELISMLERTFPKVISFRSEFEEDLPVINADHTQIHQPLLNLCVNARDAMPRGGEILIRLSTLSPEGVASRFTEAENYRYVCLQVSDTGTGMDAATKKRVFDPFFTTKETGKGTGLGLSVVYGIVKSHKGFIDVESAAGVGSTFSLYLPARIGTSLQRQSGAADGEIRGGTETILLVEDEEPLRALMRTRLEAKGYTVLEAKDGPQAIEYLGRHQKEIALVFSDLGLPGMAGVDVFRKLKEMSPLTPVIFAGGFVVPEIKDDLMKEGVDVFFQKPYQPSEVLSAIRSVLDGGSKSSRSGSEHPEAD